MARINVDINFQRYVSHSQLVTDLSPAFSATHGDHVYFEINLNAYTLLYADFLLLIVSTIFHLRNNGCVVSGVFKDFKKESMRVKYASRVNFFERIGFPYPENFVRHSGDGSFTEIERFNDIKGDLKNYENIHLQIIRILRNVNASHEMMQVFELCLTEVMDNALRHSGVLHGWASAQYFPKKKEVRLIICDTGMGIHRSLTSSPGSQYSQLNEAEALLKSIEEGVTSGDGMGHGLFITSEFIRANAGELIIYSGGHFLACNAKGITVSATNYWNGTFLFFKINTDVSVDFKEILGKDSTRDDDYQWLIDEKLNVDEMLW